VSRVPSIWWLLLGLSKLSDGTQRRPSKVHPPLISLPVHCKDDGYLAFMAGGEMGCPAPEGVTGPLEWHLESLW
jgi:hypothetical protein